MNKTGYNIKLTTDHIYEYVDSQNQYFFFSFIFIIFLFSFLTVHKTEGENSVKDTYNVNTVLWQNSFTHNIVIFKQ